MDQSSIDALLQPGTVRVLASRWVREHTMAGAPTLQRRQTDPEQSRESTEETLPRIAYARYRLLIQNLYQV